MPSRWRWILVVAAATGLDLLARFAAPFDFRRVMHIEAGLFPGTTLVLAVLIRHEPSTRGWSHAARLSLIWLFGLGGLRPLLWTLGLSVAVANLATVGAALAGVLVLVLRHRHRVPG
jgi:hypothetical protein